MKKEYVKMLCDLKKIHDEREKEVKVLIKEMLLADKNAILNIYRLVSVYKSKIDYEEQNLVRKVIDDVWNR